MKCIYIRLFSQSHCNLFVPSYFSTHGVCWKVFIWKVFTKFNKHQYCERCSQSLEQYNRFTRFLVRNKFRTRSFSRIKAELSLIRSEIKSCMCKEVASSKKNLLSAKIGKGSLRKHPSLIAGPGNRLWPNGRLRGDTRRRPLGLGR